jgi:hypothetical protein
VNVTLHRQPPLVDEPSVEPTLGQAMLRAMPADHRAIDDAEVRFEKVWRWHPRDNEELILGRWTARPKGTGGRIVFELAVFKVCANVPVLVARMHGPVAQFGKPAAGADPQKLTLPVQTDSDKGDVKLTYSYGAVQVEHPPWVKPGTKLAPRDAPTSAPSPPGRDVRSPVLRLPGGGR